MDCVFCKIIAGDAEAVDFIDHMVGVVSFVPLNPRVPGHRLFVPETHVPDAGTRPVITGRVFTTAASWQRMKGTSANLITSTGVEATQSVFHLHVHYVPRLAGDGLTLPWTGQTSGE